MQCIKNERGDTKVLFYITIPDSYGETGWGTFELGVLAKGQMGLGHTNGQIAKALLFIDCNLLLSLLAVGHTSAWQ